MANLNPYFLTGLNISVGVPGQPAPNGATLVGLVDGSGNLQAVSASNPLPTTGGGGGGGNAAAGATGSAVPAFADYLGINNGSGTLVGVSATNPLPITGSISAVNPSVGSVGSAAPSSAGLVGFANGSGNLTAVSATAPLPVTGTVNQGSAPWADNLTQIGGNAVATAASGIAKVGLTDGTGNAISSTSGALNVDITNASLPLPTGGATSANQTNASQKTQIVDGSGNVIGSTSNALNVDVTNAITANAGTNLNTSALALESGGNLATVASAVLTQASTTSGQKGVLLQGAVTTASPTYTTAQTSPVSLTTAGALRVDASATTQPVSGTVSSLPSTANLFVGNATSTGTSSTSVVATAGAGLKNYITGYRVYNSGSVSTPITIQNGNGGSTLDTCMAPSGGGITVTLETPIATSANTAIYFAATSASTTIGISINGFTGA